MAKSPNQSIVNRVAAQLELDRHQVQGAMSLLDAGNTVPFIARYRKEGTGNLDEVQIRDVSSAADKLRQLDKRRSTIVETIADQGNLDSQLREKIERARTLSRLNDLYAPYRSRRRTRGQKAREAKLQPVAQAIWDGDNIRGVADQHICEAFAGIDAVIDGAKDIIAEDISEDARVRERVRREATKRGQLACRQRRGGDDDPNFKLYFDFSASVEHVKPHQVLAIRRGENEKVLSAGIDVDDDRLIDWISNHVDDAGSRQGQKLVDEAIKDGYKRLIHPTIEREIRRELEQRAETHAIGVFAVNLENLLLQPPLPNRRVLGIDPGYRSGCKMAVVSREGAYETHQIIYVHDSRRQQAADKIRRVIESHDIDVIAVGNGTASRETEQAVADAIGHTKTAVEYAMVDEAGASVYSASAIARREFPELDVSVRGAISIGRRLQDPLAELVKIDPQSIGVGMYQHDVNQNRLMEALDGVVEDVVNGVGVDLASASQSLLSRVAGIGPTLAERIVNYRSQRGGIADRRELCEVRGVGAKTFEQCAGFLRIHGGRQPLDQSGIHPENYTLARAILDAAGVRLGDDQLEARLEDLQTSGQLTHLADAHDVGQWTLDDIVQALLRPGRDPREALDAPQLRSDVLKMDDLTEGMGLSGTVRNVVDFGAFVDIGVKQDGLVHVSEMADRYVKNPHEIVSVGDQVEVVILSVDQERGRIGLSIEQY